MSAGYLAIGLVALTVAALARTGNVPRFLVRLLTTRRVDRPSLAERTEDKRQEAAILTGLGRVRQHQEAAYTGDVPVAFTRRVVHPITVFEREKAIGVATIKRIRLAKTSNDNEAA